MNEIERSLLLPERKIIVCSNEINMSQKLDNKIFLLFVEESKGSAGGRGGGSGNRRISRIIGFEFLLEKTKKIFDTIDQYIINKFEMPYSAVAMDIKLSDGKEYVVQGVIDPIMIDDYEKIVKIYRESTV